MCLLQKEGILQVETNFRCGGYPLTLHTSACSTQGFIQHLFFLIGPQDFTGVIPTTAHASFVHSAREEITDNCRILCLKNSHV